MKYKQTDDNNFLVGIHCSNHQCFAHNVVVVNCDRESFEDLNSKMNGD